MNWLVFWRLARTGLAVWALASGIFLLSHHDLSGAARMATPDAADLPMGGSANPSAVQQQATTRAILQRLSAGLPLFYLSRPPAAHPGQWHWNGRGNQYHRWVIALLHGDLGNSFRTGQAVTTQLSNALTLTMPLTGTAAALAVLAAIFLARRLAAGPWWQRPVRAALAGLHALPLFLVALVLLLLLANPEALDWFPAYGFDQALDTDADFWTRVATYALHLALPVTALVITALPELTLQLDTALRHELRAGYATTARAKGLAEGAVIRHHAFRNAMLPTLTQVAELLPALVAGAVVVEVVFALPGMGSLLAAAAAARDYPVLVGGVLLTGTARLLALLLADVLYFWADPRIRWHV